MMPMEHCFFVGMCVWNIYVYMKVYKFCLCHFGIGNTDHKKILENINETGDHKFELANEAAILWSIKQN